MMTGTRCLIWLILIIWLITSRRVFSDVKRSSHVGMAFSSRQPVSVYSQINHQVPSDIGNMFSEIAEKLLQTIQLIETHENR